MATNPFKSFIVYTTSRTNDYDPLEDTTQWPGDPTGGTWRTVGLVNTPNGVRLDSYENHKLGCAQFNERILPGAVIKEELDKRVARLHEQQGHKVSKKDRAQLRDQVEFDLLQHAFIKRSLVYFALINIKRKPAVLVFTSSQKRADEVATLLDATMDGSIKPQKIDQDGRMGGWLTALANNGSAAEFFSGKSASLVGPDGKKITIKDMEVDAHSVQNLLADGFAVTSLGLGTGGGDIDATDYTFTLTDKAIFKAFVIDGVKPAQIKEDFAGYAVLCVTQIKAMLQSVLLELENCSNDGTNDL